MQFVMGRSPESRRRRLPSAKRAAVAAASVGAALSVATLAAGPAVAAKPHAALTNITVGVVSNGPPEIPFYVAEQKGFFKKEGLNVTTSTLGGGQAATDAALDSGSINVGLAGGTAWILGIAQGAINGKIFAELNDGGYSLAAAPGITRVQQLEGKTIAVSSQNGSDQIWVEALLKHFGIPPQNETYVALGTPNNRLVEMDKGAAQASEVLDSQTPPGTNIIESAAKSPIEVPATAFFAPQSFIKAHKKALIAFTKAMGLADTWSKTHGAAADNICVAENSGTLAECRQVQQASHNRAIDDAYTWSATEAVNQTTTRAAIKAIAAFSPAAAGLTIPKVIDTSIAGTRP